jgi:hypothetical protein
MGKVMSRLKYGLAHQTGRPGNAVEPGAVDHLDDCPNPSALLTHSRGSGLFELDLTGGIGPVPELVLEPLNEELIHLSVRTPTGQEETCQTTLGLRQDEKRIHSSASSGAFRSAATEDDVIEIGQP